MLTGFNFISLLGIMDDGFGQCGVWCVVAGERDGGQQDDSS